MITKRFREISSNILPAEKKSICKVELQGHNISDKKI